MNLAKAITFRLLFPLISKDLLAALIVFYTKHFGLDAERDTIIVLFDKLTLEEE